MPAKPCRMLRALLIALALSTAVIPNVVSASRFGLYTDDTGSTCSFSVNPSGVLTAYLVVKAGPEGVLGMRFAAPVPACLGGTFLYETPADNVTIIGSSPTGISLAFPTCVIPDAPSVALTITYFTSGATAPCCAFPIVADPFVGTIEVTDCNFEPGHATPITSHFNADASCPCFEGNPPHSPTTPTPANLATNVGPRPVLGWVPNAADEIFSYDVYFGTTAMPVYYTTVTSPSLQLPLLTKLTQYYWRVVARDLDGLEMSGPTWSFTTANNTAPPPPGLQSPANGATNQLLNITLQWLAVTDANGDAITYDVYFGAGGGTPPLYATALSVAQLVLPTLAENTQYRWRVVARDPWGAQASSATWSFTTRYLSNPPSAPAVIAPVSGATAVGLDVTLQWSATDLDGDPLTYDLYFGTESVPPLLASGLTTAAYTLPTLAYTTIYRWRVVARDPTNLETTGATWTFTTQQPNEPPSAVQWSEPANLALASPLVMLRWTVTDPDGDLLTYDLFFGTASDPPLVATGLTDAQYAPGPLALSTDYFWKVVSHDSFGHTTPNSVYKFTTTSSIPPNEPGNPNPANGATNILTTLTLSWECSDPEDDPLTYKVYFGTPGNMPLIASGLTTPNRQVAGLNVNTEYNWQVRARDNHGVEALSPLWSFHTRPNIAPVLTSWSPADGAIDVAPTVTLLWHASDEETNPVTYDVYFGTAEAPPLVASNQTPAYYTPGPLATGTTYYWKVVPRDPSGPGSSTVFSFTTAGALTGSDGKPLELALGRNHPNPFNPQTIIPYSVPVGNARVRLIIHDSAGRIVRTLVDENQDGGAREAVWTGDDDRGTKVASGIYYCVLRVGAERRTQKLVLLK